MSFQDILFSFFFSLLALSPSLLFKVEEAYLREKETIQGSITENMPSLGTSVKAVDFKRAGR